MLDKIVYMYKNSGTVRDFNITSLSIFKAIMLIFHTNRSNRPTKQPQTYEANN